MQNKTLLGRFRKALSPRSSRVNRSKYGNAFMTIFVSVFALFSLLPLILSIGMSLKPINELYVFPPTFIPREPTFDNYKMLFSLIDSTRVAFSRYFFNTVFISFVTVILHVLAASMAAFALSKGNFPGRKTLNQIVLLALMFVPAIADVINYQTIVSLGWLDTYMAAIAPNVASSVGLFLMTNYMSTISNSLIEAAQIDGCSDFRTCWAIVMPLCKPAWLTLIIIMFQNIWGMTHSNYIYSEALKPLPYALQQITTGGYIRAGAAQAAGVIMLIIPAAVFIINQSNILETMASSGIKE